MTRRQPVPAVSRAKAPVLPAEGAREAGAGPASSGTRGPSPPLDLTGLVESLVQQGLCGASVDDHVREFCRRIVASGFPARRFNMTLGTLHPGHGARSYVWRGDTIATEEYPRQRSGEENEAYVRSPIYHLRNSGEVRLRRRLDVQRADDFPLLAELRNAGMTDYAARLIRFDAAHAERLDRPDPLPGIFFSCTTDAPGGFDDDQLRQVGDVLPYLALAVKSRSATDVSRTLLETYLGADAGRRVLTGEIDRHTVQRIQAVIWLCDLRGFSSVASRVPQDELIEILDAYLEALGRPVLDNDGQILKFLGDGFLATFDLSQRDVKVVCEAAVDAAEALLEAFPRFNADRRGAGKSTLEFGLALHLGEVLYGNIGTRERLDFTVFGSAVNEASRIEGLCKPLRRKVLVSGAFHQAGLACGGRITSVGVHALRGIREPQELFTLVNA